MLVMKHKKTGEVISVANVQEWICPYYGIRCVGGASLTIKEARGLRAQGLVQQKFLKMHIKNKLRFLYIEGIVSSPIQIKLIEKLTNIDKNHILNFNVSHILEFYPMMKIPMNQNDFDSHFYGAHKEYLDRSKNIMIENESEYRFVWNTDEEFDSIEDIAVQRNWEQTYNFVRPTSQQSQLSTPKLIYFLKTLRSLRGQNEYEDQKIAFIFKKNQIIGLCFISLHFELSRGRILDISEISLFDEKEISRVLPLVIKNILNKVLTSVKCFSVKIDTFQGSPNTEVFVNTAKMFGGKEFPPKIFCADITRIAYEKL